MGLEAYCDESGTHGGSPIMLMASYVSTEEKWRCFREKWSVMLAHSQREQIHLTDLLKHDAATIDKQTARWAVEIIKSTIEIGMCFAFVESDFDELTTPRIKKELGDAYAFLTQMTLAAVGTAEHLQRYPGDIMYIFEKGGPRWKKADSLLRRISLDPDTATKYRYRNHAFEGKPETPPLQAADVLANLLYRSYRDHGTFERSSLHPLLIDLVDHTKHVYHFLARRDLKQIILDSMRYNDQRIGTLRAVQLKGWNP